jgi:hypothetical protein
LRLALGAFPAAAALFARHIAEHLLDVTAASRERRLLALRTRHTRAHRDLL